MQPTFLNSSQVMLTLLVPRPQAEYQLEVSQVWGLLLGWVSTWRQGG